MTTLDDLIKDAVLIPSDESPDASDAEYTLRKGNYEGIDYYITYEPVMVEKKKMEQIVKIYIISGNIWIMYRNLGYYPDTSYDECVIKVICPENPQYPAVTGFQTISEIIRPEDGPIIEKLLDPYSQYKHNTREITKLDPMEGFMIVKDYNSEKGYYFNIMKDILKYHKIDIKKTDNMMTEVILIDNKINENNKIINQTDDKKLQENKKKENEKLVDKNTTQITNLEKTIDDIKKEETNKKNTNIETGGPSKTTETIDNKIKQLDNDKTILVLLKEHYKSPFNIFITVLVSIIVLVAILALVIGGIIYFIVLAVYIIYFEKRCKRAGVEFSWLRVFKNILTGPYFLLTYYQTFGFALK